MPEETEKLAAGEFPIGAIIAWPGLADRLPSDDWHLCDGSYASGERMVPER